MSAPDAATVAAVLAEHRYRDVLGDYEIKPYYKHFGCSCGWEQNIAGMSGYWSWLEAHEAHVAAAVLASEPIAQALAAVEAVARVEALAGEWVEDADTKLRGMAARVARDHAAELRALRPEGGNQ